MLTRIKLGNFKSWRELDIELAPLTLLFGTNSSGKSSILQALLMLKQREEFGGVLNFGGGERDYVDLGSYYELVYGHEEERELSLEITWRTDVEYSRSCVWHKTGDYVSTKKLTFENHLKHISVDESEALRTLSDLDLKSQVYSDYLTKFLDLMFGITYLGPLRSYPKRAYLWANTLFKTVGQHGENTIPVLVDSIRNKEELHELILSVEIWLSNMELAHDLQIKALDPDKRFYEVRIDGSSLLDTGFGVSQILPVITTLFFVPEGSIVLLEQPELHLHPSAQAHLADLFLHVAETRRLQLIVESHSEHLLRRIQRRIAEPEYAFATPENIKAYFCQPGANGSTIEEVKVDKYGQIHNWPDNFFGDIGEDLDKMLQAGIAQRRQELSKSV